MGDETGIVDGDSLEGMKTKTDSTTTETEKGSTDTTDTGGKAGD